MADVSELRKLLAEPGVRDRSGGPLLVAWKARGFFKVVAPTRCDERAATRRDVGPS